MGAFLSGLVNMIANIFGFANRRFDAKNAPDVKAAQVAKEEQKKQDRENKIIQENDDDAIEKGIS